MNNEIRRFPKIYPRFSNPYYGALRKLCTVFYYFLLGVNSSKHMQMTSPLLHQNANGGGTPPHLTNPRQKHVLRLQNGSNRLQMMLKCTLRRILSQECSEFVVCRPPQLRHTKLSHMHIILNNMPGTHTVV